MTEWIQTYGLWAVLLGAVLEGEAVLIVAGYAVAGGLLPAEATLVTAVLGATLGDHAFYLVGRTWGTALVHRVPRLRRLRAHAILHARRWGRPAAFVLRFAYGLRSVLPLGLGAARFRPRLFTPYNVLGALAFSVVYLGLGFLFGEAAHAILAQARGQVPVSLLMISVVAAFWFAVRALRLRQRWRCDGREVSS